MASSSFSFCSLSFRFRPLPFFLTFQPDIFDEGCSKGAHYVCFDCRDGLFERGRRERENEKKSLSSSSSSTSAKVEKRARKK